MCKCAKEWKQLEEIEGVISKDNYAIMNGFSGANDW